MVESTVLGGAVFFLVPETGTAWRSLSAEPTDVEVLSHYPPETRYLATFGRGRFVGTCSGPWSPSVARCANNLRIVRALRAAGQ